MRTSQVFVRSLILRTGKSAFELMREAYGKWNRPNWEMIFEDDLIDYALNGFVRISPTAMFMAKICRDEKGDYWFVRCAVGSLLELLASAPVYLPRIKWCRRNDGVMREYRTDRLYKLAYAKMKEREA